MKNQFHISAYYSEYFFLFPKTQWSVNIKRNSERKKTKHWIFCRWDFHNLQWQILEYFLRLDCWHFLKYLTEHLLLVGNKCFQLAGGFTILLVYFPPSTFTWSLNFRLHLVMHLKHSHFVSIWFFWVYHLLIKAEKIAYQ